MSTEGNSGVYIAFLRARRSLQEAVSVVVEGVLTNKRAPFFLLSTSSPPGFLFLPGWPSVGLIPPMALMMLQGSYPRRCWRRWSCPFS